MASKVINISLPEELLQDIDQIARQERRTRSEFFREAVRRYLETKGLLATFSWTEADRRSFATLSDSALTRIWDNERDAVYDDWKPKRHGKSTA